MLKRNFTRLLCAAALVATGLSTTAQAQDANYPNKPIRFVVPYPPGGPLDTVARTLAEQVKPMLGTVVVENKPGAGGNIGADLVAKSAPDGYAIVMGAVATHAINPTLFPKIPYDPVRDFAPITLVANVPNVLILNADLAKREKIESLADLVAYAKRNPGKLNMASGGNGSAGHLAGELFKAQAGVFALHIPYAGAAPAQMGMLAGQTDFMFDNLASAAPRIREGKVKALAVTTRERAVAFPDIPTMAQAGEKLGLKDFEVSTWFGIFAPAKTPTSVVARLNADFNTALKSEPVRARLAKMAAEPAPGTPEALGALVVAELKKYAEVIRRSGAKVD
ncbi:MAG: tripartite tricarboxylate transporter substrate binding protein [Pseudomonadota bacterium]